MWPCQQHFRTFCPNDRRGSIFSPECACCKKVAIYMSSTIDTEKCRLSTHRIGGLVSSISGNLVQTEEGVAYFHQSVHVVKKWQSTFLVQSSLNIADFVHIV